MRNNVSEPLDRACAGRILSERNIRSHLVIIDGIFRKASAKVIRVERDQMVSALAPDRPDQGFGISVLPGRAERGGPVPDAHCSHPSLERAAKCSVVVTDSPSHRRVGLLSCRRSVIPASSWTEGRQARYCRLGAASARPVAHASDRAGRPRGS
jgi:hypothetical protein